MQISLTVFGRSVTVEVSGLSYFSVGTDGYDFIYDRHQWFELPTGEFRHWWLEKKRPYQPPTNWDDLPQSVA